MDKPPEVAGNKKMVRAGGPHFNVLMDLVQLDVLNDATAAAKYGVPHALL